MITKLLRVIQFVVFVRRWWGLANPLKLLFMAWNTPNTMSVGDVFSASNYNTYVRDNLNYLLTQRTLAKAVYVGASNPATTSTTFVNTDGTNHKISITPNSTRVKVTFTFTAQQPTAAHFAEFDILCSSPSGRFGDATHGMAQAPVNNGFIITLVAYFTGLTAGAAVSFTLQHRVDNAAATSTIINNGASVVMIAEEI